MSRALTFGKAAIELSLLSDGIDKQLAALEARFQSFGSKLMNVGKVGLAIGGAITAPFVAGLKTFADAGSQLNDLSDRTGFSVEALSELGYIADQTGASLDAVEKGARGMARMILDAERGLSTATDTLDDLGLSLSDLQGLTPEEQFNKLASSIAAVDDPSRRAALAMKAFGRTGSELLPMLKDGPEALDAMRQKAHDLGLVLSTEDAKAADDLGDAFDTLWASVKFVSIQLGAAIAGPVTAFITKAQSVVTMLINWIKTNRVLVAGIAAVGAILLGISSVLIATGATIIYVGKAINLCKIAIHGVTAAVKGLTKAMAYLIANPIVALIAAVAVVILAILYWTGVLGKLFRWLGRIVGITDEATESAEDYSAALNKVKAPDLDLDKLKEGIDIEATASGGLAAARSAEALFDLSVARQTIGDAGIQEKQLEELRRVNKNLERRQGVPVR